MTPAQKENFERAFSSGFTGARRTCECGKTFYDPVNDWDWDEGQLEALQADKNAVALDYSVGTVIFGGKEYVMDCECWPYRADNIVAFLEAHQHGLKDFLAREKARKLQEAEATPVL